MAWLCGLLSYGQAAEVMRRIGKRSVSDSRLWRLAPKVGRALKAQEGLEQKPEAQLEVAGEAAQPDTRLLSMEGGMVNIEGEGWKELKVGLVGTVVIDEPASGDKVKSGHTTAAHYCAVLGDVTTFTPVVLDLARRTGFEETARSCITADGAAWIWNLADAHFPDSLQIVDYYHARQPLSLAAQALFPDQPARVNIWFHAHTDDLFEGALKPILADLEQPGLTDCAAYFQTHQARMNYSHFQDEGYPIGSASVESEVNQFKRRLDGPGMYWSRQAAENMIRIRAPVLDGSFDTRWASAA
jgi:hypothetical protein